MICAVDLHVHTVLSPCAEVEMIPPLIVARALEAGLDLIAVCDHNSAENAAAVIRAAEGTPLRVLPGLEVESVEGVHLVCLFDEVESALAMQEAVYAALPRLPNKAETFGAQFVVDATGEFVRENTRLLLVPTGLSILEVTEAARGLGGFVLPAHVDRVSYGMLGVLGFMPDEPRFSAVEVSRHFPEDGKIEGYALFRSSDAHRLEELGSGRTALDLPHRSVTAIRDYAGDIATHS
ncbi:MAG: PHP domain-containing protein [Armatimonadota bacterium]